MNCRMRVGAWGERKAREYLELNGYRVLETNWRCPVGEIDIVAMDGSTIVFIEVRTRTSNASGRAVESVNQRKRARLSRLALWYLTKNGIRDVQCRFDVVCIRVMPPGNYELSLIKNAFLTGD